MASVSVSTTPATVRRLTPAAFPAIEVNSQVKVEVPFRLNRRGRQVRALFILLALVSLLFIGGQKVAHASSHSVIVSVTVAPGESLWDIATSVNPNQDPRDTIEQIKALNEIKGSDIEAGTSLMVPRY